VTRVGVVQDGSVARGDDARLELEMGSGTKHDGSCKSDYTW
jgi:hypothetical protein